MFIFLTQKYYLPMSSKHLQYFCSQAKASLVALLHQFCRGLGAGKRVGFFIQTTTKWESLEMNAIMIGGLSFGGQKDGKVV